MPRPLSPARREIVLSDIQATQTLATSIALLALPGDVVALRGNLGSGKTTFARFFIAARGGAGEVPSPTFTLLQVYLLPAGEIWHFDLYRIENERDVLELGIDEAFRDAISLIEWPERLGSLLPNDRLDIALDFADRADARRALLTGQGSWVERVVALAI
ncbi:MAG: tRNA (adenosine(37)-N6)-threonylcarbamoyltransferase complex ATPase subunit type 1 TsaE [Alphaproteobacteria bacterium]|nr:tRNA (adenosine(37)-N6)-threonylcarbamoyltransferase complex ATPase subunit type 1 TsaE [Alphaproteobacteria bacterium]